MHHAGFGAGGHHLAGVGKGQRQRLFAQHVLAGRGGSQRLRLVQLVGGADVDGVDLGVGQQRVEPSVSCGNAVGLRVLGAARARRCSSRRRTSLPGCARMAPMIHSRAMVLAPIRPQPNGLVAIGFVPRLRVLAGCCLCYSVFERSKALLLERSNRLSIWRVEHSLCQVA